MQYTVSHADCVVAAATYNSAKQKRQNMSVRLMELDDITLNNMLNNSIHCIEIYLDCILFQKKEKDIWIHGFVLFKKKESKQGNCTQYTQQRCPLVLKIQNIK